MIDQENQNCEGASAPLFFGAEFSNDKLNNIMTKNLKPELYKHERKFYATKHPDYYHLHPCAAFYRFAHSYRDIHRKIVKKYFDRNRNDTGIPDDPFWIKSKSVITSLWKARQIADVIGCNYEFYIWNAMELSLRVQKDKPPRPSEIIAGWIVQEIGVKWEQSHPKVKKLSTT